MIAVFALCLSLLPAPWLARILPRRATAGGLERLITLLLAVLVALSLLPEAVLHGGLMTMPALGAGFALPPAAAWLLQRGRDMAPRLALGA